jgi:excisionase family DNA binding protein
MTNVTKATELTPAEAAEILGVSTRTLTRWVKQGHLDVRVLPSGQRRYYVEDVRRLASETFGEAS